MNFPALFFLDFDHTLFSTEAFWDDVRKTCATHLGIPEKVFLETYQKAKSPETVYDIDAHVKLLGISQGDIMSVFTLVFAQKSYVFSDVLPFLDNHSDDTIVIVTQGVDWFQRVKVTSLHTNGRSIRTIVTNYKKRLYIEDRVGFHEDGVLWEGNHYNSLTFVDNMADAFLPEDHGVIFRQYRIRRGDADPHAKEPTRKGSIEITTLLDI